MLAFALAVVFSLLALLHFYWAAGGRAGWQGGVPEVDGRPAFTPSTAATVAVAVALLLCAALVAGAGGLAPLPLPAVLTRWLSFALALVLLARAIGDFRLVGFFKRVRGSRFARLDSTFYSPLCLGLAAGVFLVAWNAPH